MRRRKRSESGELSKAGPDTVRVPLAMPAALEAKVVSTAREVKLSKQDTMRLSLERGLDVLLAQLKPEGVTP